jgi:hypothetical protein
LNLNPNAIKLLEENPNKIDWCRLSINSNAIHLLEKNTDKILYGLLCQNSNAINLLEANVNKLDEHMCWIALNDNTNQQATNLLLQNINKLDDYQLDYISRNPNAPEFLIANPDKICWSNLCENPKAIHLLKKKIRIKLIMTLLV